MESIKEIKLNDESYDYFHLKEILNDLYKYGFSPNDKASIMLKDFILEKQVDINFPKTKQKIVHIEKIGRGLW